MQLLKPDQWQRLVKRLGEIPNPTVPVGASGASLPANGKKGSAKGKQGKKAPDRASNAHLGE